MKKEMPKNDWVYREKNGETIDIWCQGGNELKEEQVIWNTSLIKNDRKRDKDTERHKTRELDMALKGNRWSLRRIQTTVIKYQGQS